MSRQPRGRRPGRSDTKARIALAARSQFADRGFAKTTLRTIADEAGVDTRLVSHYYGSKQQLFLAVVSLPSSVDEVVAKVANLPASGVAEALATHFVELVDNERTGETLAGLLEAAAGEETAAHTLQEMLHQQLWGPLLSHLEVNHPHLRADLLGSVAAGYVFSRRIMGAASLAEASREESVAALAPLFEHALSGGWPHNPSGGAVPDEVSSTSDRADGAGYMPRTEVIPAHCEV